VSILLYAISRDDARAPAARELHEICSAGLRALTEPVEAPLTADLEELVHYEETVEAVMQGHTILPMRFGSVVDDEQEVRDLLKARAREFGMALAQLDGAVEFGVQASVGTGSSPASAGGSTAAGPGESYMRKRLDEHRCRRELRAWLDAELDGVVRRSVYRVTPVCGPGSISAAYLVDRAATDEFLERIAALATTADNTLSWSGPWPPYTFVEELDP
jgi:hypothetical protein